MLGNGRATLKVTGNPVGTAVEGWPTPRPSPSERLPTETVRVSEMAIGKPVPVGKIVGRAVIAETETGRVPVGSRPVPVGKGKLRFGTDTLGRPEPVGRGKLSAGMETGRVPVGRTPVGRRPVPVGKGKLRFGTDTLGRPDPVGRGKLTLGMEMLESGRPLPPGMDNDGKVTLGKLSVGTDTGGKLTAGTDNVGSEMVGKVIAVADKVGTEMTGTET